MQFPTLYQIFLPEISSRVSEVSSLPSEDGVRILAGMQPSDSMEADGEAGEMLACHRIEYAKIALTIRKMRF
jgi:hypothetical protein